MAVFWDHSVWSHILQWWSISYFNEHVQEIQQGGDYNDNLTLIQLSFNSHSTAIWPQYNHSTYITSAGLPVCGLLHWGLNK